MVGGGASVLGRGDYFGEGGEKREFVTDFETLNDNLMPYIDKIKVQETYETPGGMSRIMKVENEGYLGIVSTFKEDAKVYLFSENCSEEVNNNLEKLIKGEK